MLEQKISDSVNCAETVIGAERDTVIRPATGIVGEAVTTATSLVVVAAAVAAARVPVKMSLVMEGVEVIRSL